MKTISRSLLLTVLLCTGCTESWLLPAKFGMDAPPAKPAPVAVEEPAKPLSADQVTPTNARSMAAALEKELDQADHP